MPEKAERGKEAEIPAFRDSGRRVGDYLLGQRIGAGDMGSVFLAKQISTQKLVAVKILRSDCSADPVYMERFFQEVRLLARLENPHIVQAIEAGLDQRTCFFAMEYVDGRDLRTELAIQEHLSEKEVLRVARDVARAMAYAWKEHRMIHHDIKPANIMRTRTGTTKLLDLGISKKKTASAGSRFEPAGSGLAVGSPVYVSPELARGSKEIDLRSDIYSLGIVMYHLLAGHPPYDSRNSMSIVNMHLTCPIPVLQKEITITPGTSTLIREMMCKDPGGRPSSWEEIERRTVRLLGQFDTVPSPLLQDEENACGGLFPRGKMFLICLTLLLAVVILLSTIILVVRKKRMPGSAPARTNIVKVVSPAPKKAESDPELTEQRKMEKSVMLRLSGKRESSGDLAGALNLWKNYRPPAELRDDPELRRFVEEQIRYLEERLQKQPADALP